VKPVAGPETACDTLGHGNRKAAQPEDTRGIGDLYSSTFIRG